MIAGPLLDVNALNRKYAPNEVMIGTDLRLGAVTDSKCGAESLPK